MTEAGTLSIRRRGTGYHVRYASNNPYDQERRPYTCPDEAHLAALLHHCGAEVAMSAEGRHRRAAQQDGGRTCRQHVGAAPGLLSPAPPGARVAAMATGHRMA